MSCYYHIHAEARGYVVCMTASGLDHSPIPRAAFGKPRDAVRYADMRQQAVSPLRVSVEDVGSPPLTSSVEPLTRLGK